MRNRARTFLVTTLLLGLLAASATAQLTPYSQDFEGLVQTELTALENDGWVIFGNVFDTDGTTFLYPYGPFPAPNDGAAFCAIALLEGGIPQGVQQLNVYSDYNNVDHAIGRYIQSNVFQEQTIGAGNIGERWVFQFDAKRGNLEGETTAAAFIKTIDPNSGFIQTNYFHEDMTEKPTTWGTYFIAIDIIPELVGQFLQFGFLNVATNYEGSAVLYDNIVFDLGNSTPAPSVAVTGATLGQNFPNPFNPSTEIAFTLDRAGDIRLSVYDLAGRRVATIHQGPMGAGDHTVPWNGKNDAGVAVASGRYNYVLQTSGETLSRSMVLLK